VLDLRIAFLHSSGSHRASIQRASDGANRLSTDEMGFSARMPQLYDQIAQSYAQHRKPDPRIAAAIIAALGDAESVVNIGAGAASYEPRGRRVIAVEPSARMIAQRRCVILTWEPPETDFWLTRTICRTFWRLIALCFRPGFAVGANLPSSALYPIPEIAPMASFAPIGAGQKPISTRTYAGRFSPSPGSGISSRDWPGCARISRMGHGIVATAIS
jgi:hypothetical protein